MMLPVHKMKTNSFTPNPEKLVENIIGMCDANAALGIIHGSYLYSGAQGLPNSTYIDTRVYDRGRFIESRLDLVAMQPDVDIVIITEDENFKQKFEEFSVKESLISKLNYNITLNVVSEKIVKEEIIRKGTSALKTIFNLRDHKVYGNNQLFNTLAKLANKYTTSIDQSFLDQYYHRKTIIRQNAWDSIDEFTISREVYSKDFPLLLNHFEGTYYSGFPKNRIKIELPFEVVLKKRLDLDKNNLISNAHNI